MLGHCVWHCFQLALGHLAILPAGCSWSWHRGPPLALGSPKPLMTRGQYSHTVLPAIAASPRYPSPFPGLLFMLVQPKPFHAGCCWARCAPSACSAALSTHRRASAPTPASAVVTLCFATSQHPSVLANCPYAASTHLL